MKTTWDEIRASGDWEAAEKMIKTKEAVGLNVEESYIELLRRSIEEQYRGPHRTGTGASFDELLCHEIHENGLTFRWLAEKWGLSLAALGELIADHCRRLAPSPLVNHGYRKDQHNHEG